MDISTQLENLCQTIYMTHNSIEYYEKYGIIISNKCPLDYELRDWDFGLSAAIKNEKTNEWEHYVLFRCYVETYDIENKYELNEVIYKNNKFQLKNVSGACDIDDYDFEDGEWTIEQVKQSLLKSIAELETLNKHKIIEKRLENLEEDFK